MYGNISAANAWWEKALRYVGIERVRAREAAQRAEAKDTTLSPESQAALERGDRQRATGIYDDSSLNDDTARGLYADANTEDMDNFDEGD